MSTSSKFALACTLALAPRSTLASATANVRPEGPEPASVTSTSPAPVDARRSAGERRGSGLIAAGALVGALALAANGARIGLSRRLCRDVTYDAEARVLHGADACLTDAETVLFLGPVALGLNLTAFGLVAAGGNVHGRWAAQWAPSHDRRPQRGGGQIAVGVSVMLAGLVGYAIVRTGSYLDGLGFNTCSARHDIDLTDDDPANSALAECLRNRYAGYLGGIMAAQTVSVIGVGVLAHGASMRRHSGAFAAAAHHQLRLRPRLSPTWAGLSLSGRF